MRSDTLQRPQLRIIFISGAIRHRAGDSRSPDSKDAFLGLLPKYMLHGYPVYMLDGLSCVMSKKIK